MDGKELKYRLSQISKDKLTQAERDYLNGRITFDQYLILCYNDYVNSFLHKRYSQDAIYD